MHDDDHPIARGLEDVNVAADDPRLARWAEGTATPAERAALEREAASDPALAARLERLAPFDEAEREDLVDLAMNQLEPSGAVLPFRRYVAVALAAAAAVALFVAWPDATLEVLERPRARVEADEVVTLALGGTDEPPALYVVRDGATTEVPIAWDGAGRRWSIAVPAHVLTGGTFGDVELALATAGERPGAGPRMSIHVAMPRYAVQEAVAVLHERVRGGDDALREGAIVVPDGAETIRVTLIPKHTVRSGVTACPLRETTVLEAVGGCRTFADGRVVFDLAAADLEGATAVVVVTASEPIDATRAIVIAKGAASPHAVRIPLR